jgi:CII-binding regulator of phage lambda lysogenization HflD
LEADISNSKSTKKRLGEDIKELKKELNAMLKDYRKKDHDVTYFKSEILKADNELRGTIKAVEDLDKKLKKLEESKESLNEEHQLLIASLVKKGLEEKNMENKIRQLGQQIE